MYREYKVFSEKGDFYVDHLGYCGVHGYIDSGSADGKRKLFDRGI